MALEEGGMHVEDTQGDLHGGWWGVAYLVLWSTSSMFYTFYCPSEKYTTKKNALPRSDLHACLKGLWDRGEGEGGLTCVPKVEGTIYPAFGPGLLLEENISCLWGPVPNVILREHRKNGARRGGGGGGIPLLKFSTYLWETLLYFEG